MRKYIVTIRKSYIDMEFAFNSMEDAGIFIGTALNAYRKDENRDLHVSIEMIDEADSEVDTDDVETEDSEKEDE